MRTWYKFILGVIRYSTIVSLECSSGKLLFQTSPDRGIEYPLEVRRAENEDAIIACNLHFDFFFLIYKMPMEQCNLFGLQCDAQISLLSQCCKSLLFIRINTNVEYKKITVLYNS